MILSRYDVPSEIAAVLITDVNYFIVLYGCCQNEFQSVSAILRSSGVLGETLSRFALLG